MKLSFRDVEPFIKNPGKARAALLYGPDGGLARERGKLLAATVVADINDPFNVTEISEESLLADPPVLSDALSAMSMMGGRRLVVLTGAGDKSAKFIEEALGSAPGDSFLLVYAEELGPRSHLRLMFEKRPDSAGVPCYRDEGRGLYDVIRQSLTTAGLRFEGDVVTWIAQNLGNDRGVTLSELDKLIIYKGDEKDLTLEEAMQVIGSNDEITLDDVCNAVAGGEVAALDRILGRIFREGTPAVVVLRAVSRYFQKLYTVGSQADRGKTVDEVIEGLRPPVFFKQKPLLRRHVTLWPRQKLLNVLSRLLTAERLAKTTGTPAEILSARTLMHIALAAK